MRTAAVLLTIAISALPACKDAPPPPVAQTTPPAEPTCAPVAPTPCVSATTAMTATSAPLARPTPRPRIARPTPTPTLPPPLTTEQPTPIAGPAAIETSNPPVGPAKRGAPGASAPRNDHGAKLALVGAFAVTRR